MLILAALETGCRCGELLALQWHDVRLSAGELTIRAEITKTQTGRVLPVSPRLRAVLLFLRGDDPRGQEPAPLAFLFGDRAGRAMAFPKRGWQATVLLAHGVSPRWLKGGRLAPESQAAYRSLDLHFHDLRHEAASRWLEAGWPAHHVQAMLGHADLKTTSTYVNFTQAGLAESMRRYGTSSSSAPLHNVAQTPAEERRPDVQPAAALPRM